MPTPSHLLWDDRNVDHIARHRLTPEEVEEVWASRHIFEHVSDVRYRVLGRTFAGRFLTIYVDREEVGLYYVVTARPMSGRERREYDRKSGRLR